LFKLLSEPVAAGVAEAALVDDGAAHRVPDPPMERLLMSLQLILAAGSLSAP
jgi:hypothetical protein